MTTRFPFVAIVGLALAKRSLIYHTLDPRRVGFYYKGIVVVRKAPWLERLPIC